MNEEQSVQSCFETPIRVAARPGKVREIASPQQAFDFLRTCPVQEGPIYESALEACFTATYDDTAVEDARRGLKAFAKAHGFLA